MPASGVSLAALAIAGSFAASGTLRAQEVAAEGDILPSGYPTPESPSADWSVGGILRVGHTGAGTLRIEEGGAVISAMGAVVGQDAGSDGVVHIRGVGSLWNTEAASIGWEGSGALDVREGGAVVSNSGSLGLGTSGSGTAVVSGAGSTWTVATELSVGRYGEGILRIEEGGRIESGEGGVGLFTGGSGMAAVSGAGSAWMNAGDFQVGAGSEGVLTVEDGGTLGNYRGSIGRHPTGTGAVTVRGSGSTWANASDLYIGERGRGVLVIENGGAVSNIFGLVGDQFEGNGSVTVTGSGSTWTSVDDLYVGNEGTAALLIENGGAVSSDDGHIARYSDSDGVVTVTGSGSTWTAGDIYLGEGTAVLNIGAEDLSDNAGTIVANRIVGWFSAVGTVNFNQTDDIVFSIPIERSVSLNQRGSGSTTLTGAHTYTGDTIVSGGTLALDGGSIINAAATIVGLGSGNDGVLGIEGGGEISGQYGIIGSDAGGIGRATVTGAGSSWTTSHDFHVGAAGTGDLVIQDGGRVGSGEGHIGTFSGGRGAALVAGAGSTWDLGANQLRIGDDGDGVLGIIEGGAVTARASYIGQNAGSSGSAIVSGAGSSLTNTESLAVGFDGAGNLMVADGGTVTNAIAAIGAAFSEGVATVTGSGSSWITTHDLYVGGNGNGVLHIGADDLSDTAGTVSAARITTGSGSGTVNFNQTDAVVFAVPIEGSIAVNQRGTGTTTLTGTNTYTGATTVSGGTLLVNGSIASATTVASGGNLGGSGTVGTVVVEDGGILAPGNSPGQLTVAGDLSLSAGSILTFELGDPAGTPGLDSDFIQVAGDLVLDGTLNIVDAGGFGAGLYNLIGYDGALAGNGLLVGATPAGHAAGDLQVQTALAGQVNLLVSSPIVPLTFWNGVVTSADGTIHGGSGTWDASTLNWTDATGAAAGPYDPSGLLVFAGTPGEVRIGGSDPIAVSAGMQFAVDGYTIAGGELELAGPVTMRVGNGSAAGAAFTATVASDLVGPGSLAKTDLGTLILNGTNTYSGGTTIAAGTVIGNAASLQGDIDLAADTTLVFDQATDGAFAGLLTGRGRIVKEGAGVLTVSADSLGVPNSRAPSDVTDILAGALILEGALPGTVRVHEAARLGGNGRAAIVDVLPKGLFAPGNSIGISNVGTVTFAPGSIFEVELDDSGNVAGVNNDLIEAEGTQIEGGVVHVLPANGTDDGTTYTPGLTYTILTAVGGGEASGISGTFDEVTDDFAFLDFELSYDLLNVYLTSRLAGSSEGEGEEGPAPATCPSGLTFNQTATCGGVLSLASGELFAAALNLSNAEAPMALDQLSGEVHASIGTALIEDSRFPRQAALDRLAEAGEERRGAWGRTFGSWSDREGDGNAARLDRSIGGFLAGADLAAGETMRFGAFGGYSHTSFELPTRRSSGSADTWHLGVYGGGQLGPIGLRAGGAYARHAIETSRSVAFTGFDDSLSASYDAGTGQVFGELGYRLEHGAGSFEPFAGIAYANLDGDDRVEVGGAAALATEGVDTDGTFSTLGLRARGGLDLGGVSAELRGTAAWRHAFGEPDRLSARTLAGGEPFGILGVPLTKDALVLDLGMSVQTAPGASFALSYSGQHGSGIADHGLKAGVSVEF